MKWRNFSSKHSRNLCLRFRPMKGSTQEKDLSDVPVVLKILLIAQITTAIENFARSAEKSDKNHATSYPAMLRNQADAVTGSVSLGEERNLCNKYHATSVVMNFRNVTQFRATRLPPKIAILYAKLPVFTQKSPNFALNQPISSK